MNRWRMGNEYLKEDSQPSYEGSRRGALSRVEYRDHGAGVTSEQRAKAYALMYAYLGQQVGGF